MQELAHYPLLLVCVSCNHGRIDQIWNGEVSLVSSKKLKVDMGSGTQGHLANVGIWRILYINPE